MKKNILFILFIFIAQVLPAQDNKSRIRVTDKNDRPLSQVVVEIEGNQLESFVTDADGYVDLPAVKGDKLKITRFNQWQRTVELDDNQAVIRLLDTHRLYDLGYDIKTTSEQTAASVSGIASKELENSNSRNVLNQLYGRIPGLTVFQGNNLPWSMTPDIYVRGRGSFGGNHTIILVDGVERDVTLVNPQEIETIVVMKDAASLALYGNRGADGVINLITKRGGTHDKRIKAGYRATIEQPFRIPKMANAYNYANAVNEALDNDELAPRYSQRDLLWMSRGGNENILPDVDWMSQLLRENAFTNEANLELDGSSNRSKYYVYTNYTGHTGLLNNTDLNKDYSTQVTQHSLKVRSNLETYITPTTVARMNIMGRLMQYQQPNAGLSLAGGYNVPSAAFPVRTESGSWVQNQLFSNPLADKTARGYKVILQRSLLSDITIDQDLSMLVENLSAQVRLAYDNSADILDSKTKDYLYYQFSPVRNATGSIVDNQYTKYGNETELGFGSGLSSQVMRTTLWSKIMYNKNIGNHRIDISGIYGQVFAKYSGANTSYMYRDYIGQIGYNYDDRYLIQGVVSYSGSGKMPKNDKYKVYPAVSAAWIVSNESFLKSADYIDWLKIRASVGMSGMDRNLSYDMDKQFNGSGLSYVFVGNQVKNGLGEGPLRSYLIEPERELKKNVGIEVSFLKNLVIGIDGFQNNRSNIRVPSSGVVSDILGIGMTDISKGEVKNIGAEMTLTWSGKVSDFEYVINTQVSYQHNEITGILEEYVPYDYMSRKGKSIDAFYGLIHDGLYQQADFNGDGTLKDGIVSSAFMQNLQPGDVKYKDLNDDGIINEYDYSYTSNNMHPELYYGANLGLTWKEWSLFMNFQGVSRSTVSTELSSIYWPLYGNNKSISMHYLENYWSPFTTDAKYPRLTTLPNENNFRRSTLWTEKGDFLKLRNVELSYNIPDHFFSDVALNGCRIYLSGMNLFSWDSVDIMDPEQISMDYPSTKSFSLGINLIF